LASSLSALVENSNPEYEQLKTLDKNFEKHYYDNDDKKTYKRCHFSFPVSRYRPKLYAFQVLLVLKIPLNSSNMLLYDAKVCQKVYSSWYSRLVSLLFNYLNICPYVRTLLFLVPHIFWTRSYYHA